MDVNNDGKINMMDATYIKLANSGLLPNYCNVFYNVKFYGANNELKETINTRYGGNANPTFMQSYGYEAITFLTDYHNVTGELEVYGIYYAKENN